MDYGVLVSRALRIMWKYKYLWILGFLVSLGEGGGQVIVNFHKKSDLTSSFLAQPGIILLLVLSGVFLFVLFLILRYIAHGGLIHCVNRIDRSEPTGLGDGWKAGLRNFWRLFGIGILILLMIISVTVVFAAPVVVAFLIHKTLGILSLVFFIPLFVIALIVICFIDAYADRVCVIEGKGVTDSIKEGWFTFRNNLGKSIFVATISLFSSIVYGTLFILIGLGLVADFFLAWAFAGLIPAMLIGISIMLVYVVITEGIFTTFLSAFWTLSYSEIKGLIPKPAIAQSDSK